MNKKIKSLLALLMGLVMSTSIVACGGKGNDNSASNSGNTNTESNTGDDSSTGGEDSGDVKVEGKYTPPELPDSDPNATYTYKTYTTISPSNWNELTYQDNNDTQIMNYLGSSFFGFDYSFTEDGEIRPGDFKVVYEFATSLVDVSEKYGHEAGSGHSWQITIREDGAWNDGTPIVAGDFEYTAKELLNPLFKNYRANTLYNGSTVVKNAEAYVKQGMEEYVSARKGYDTWDAAKVDSKVTFDILGNTTGFGSWANSNYSKYYNNAGEGTGWAWLVCALGAATTPDAVLALQGKTWAEIEADADLKAAWDAVIGMWQTDPNEELDFFGYDYVWEKVDWADVGFKAPSDNVIELDLAQPLQLLKEDGSLSYKAAYNMASLPLVKKDLYEACKKAPVEGSELWTSTYNSSLETTASWGPYMLTEFQSGKFYKLEKRKDWFGFNLEHNKGLYQTTAIECETIAEYETAFMAFLQGDITSIGINVTKADDYKNSDRAYFTPDDFVSSLQLQSSRAGLENRQEEGINKTILCQADFRKALSLGLNRDLYAKTTTTSSLAGFGLFNSMHYYDVANGKAYRESDAAKLVLCQVYGVDPDEYGSLDEAVDAITAYDLVQARALINSAVEKAIEAGDLKADENGNVLDKVVLTYGTSEDNATVRRYYDTLNTMWTELMVGTKLEGKFELEFNASFGSKWATDFMGGAYDVCQGGWTGAAWDPGYLLMAYLDPDTAYSADWNTSLEMAEFTIKGVVAEQVQATDEEDNPVFEEDGTTPVMTTVYTATNNPEDVFTANLSLWTWWELLNGELQAGVWEDSLRVELIAHLEKAVLEKGYSVPVMYSFGASLMSYQVDYVTYEYNTFMGYGGIAYMTYNYSDAQWAEWVAANKVNGEINYK